MIIDLLQLSEQSQPISAEFEAQDINLDEDRARLTDRVRVVGKLTKHLTETEIEGSIDGKIELDCTRCLRPIETRLQIPVKAVYVTPENYTSAQDAELHGKDLDVSVCEDDKIDIAELVREQIMLSLPERFLCSDDCRGLCAKCGANKNLKSCNCIEKEMDPRWEALNKFKT